jgi:predicted DNA-binding protein (UPF0251 family)
VRKEWRLGAKIIQRVLPDRGTPTRPQRVFDPWEVKLLSGLEKTPDLREFKTKSPYTKWTDEQVETMKTMWLDGFSPNECAKVMHKSPTSVQNKIHYMVDKEILPKRKSNITDEEREVIRLEFKEGTETADICRRHMISQKFLRKIVK